jgi:predicted RNA-binding protein Jag
MPVEVVKSIDEADAILALRSYEARQAITRVMDRLEPMELSPRRAYIRRLQHQLVERFNLSSRSIGDEPMRRLRILPPAGAQANLGYI